MQGRDKFLTPGESSRSGGTSAITCFLEHISFHSWEQNPRFLNLVRPMDHHVALKQVARCASLSSAFLHGRWCAVLFALYGQLAGQVGL